MEILVKLLTLIGIVSLAECRAFSTPVNMEKLYTLEDELIAISEIVLRTEKQLHGEEDIHSLDKIKSTFEKAKEIHAGIDAMNVTSYVHHPINYLHLTKRLVRNWTDVVNTLSESQTCAKFMTVKIQNIMDNMPQEIHLSDVTKGIVRLQNMFNLSVHYLMNGLIENETAQMSLSLDDAFDLARAAYNTKYYSTAVAWLQHITTNFNKQEVTFDLTGALNRLSSAYLKLNRHTEALSTLDRVLEIDPENAHAKRNRRFIADRISKEGTDDDDVSRLTKKQELVKQLCAGTLTEKGSQAHHICMTIRKRDDSLLVKPSVQVEVLSKKPYVLLFHNITNNTLQKAFREAGYDKLMGWLYTDSYGFLEGIDGVQIDEASPWISAKHLRDKIEEIKLTEERPPTSHFAVYNMGLDGYKWSPRLTEQYLPTYRLGTFLAFLSDTEYGGDIVIPSAKLTVTPQKGALLYLDIHAHRQAISCPVRLGTQWLGEYPVYDQPEYDWCSAHSVWKPRLGKY